MRRSIKFRLFAIISAIALAFVGILTILNLFFYNDYYIFDRKRELVEIYHELNDSYSGMVEEITDRLEQLENSTGVRITIAASQNVVKYDSIFREHRPFASSFTPGSTIILYDLLGGIPVTTQDLADIQRQGYMFSITEDGSGRAPKEQSGFLCLVGFLNDRQEMLIARVPLAYMEQNTTFNLTFLAITGLLTLGVCFALAYLASRQFVRPLIEIEEVANAMADLDFSKHYTGRGGDEIGKLGQSINILSEHLEQAISALQNTNNELAREIEEKERIDSMRREFIVNVSHELKTPIALIQGYAEGLREGITESAADREFYCSTIEGEARHMNHLVMQLLDLSKLELGRETPEQTEVDLFSLCSAVTEKTAVLAAERALSVNCSHTKETMWADYGMTEQVVTNFLSNAIRYTPEGGHITMYAAREPDGSVVFSMENEGEPIAEGDLGLIFEKFYRTDKARSRESGGSGVGLAIVRAIAEAHGGACGAENTATGVRFWFRVPAGPAEMDGISQDKRST